MKHVRNIYFCYREINTTLEYRIILNVEEKDKTSLYAAETDGFKIIKVLANE